MGLFVRLCNFYKLELEVLVCVLSHDRQQLLVAVDRIDDTDDREHRNRQLEEWQEHPADNDNQAEGHRAD